jgi:hypothetical protein
VTVSVPVPGTPEEAVTVQVPSAPVVQPVSAEEPFGPSHETVMSTPGASVWEVPSSAHTVMVKSWSCPVRFSPSGATSTTQPTQVLRAWCTIEAGAPPSVVPTATALVVCW